MIAGAPVPDMAQNISMVTLMTLRDAHRNEILRLASRGVALIRSTFLDPSHAGRRMRRAISICWWRGSRGAVFWITPVWWRIFRICLGSKSISALRSRSTGTHETVSFARLRRCEG